MRQAFPFQVPTEVLTAAQAQRRIGTQALVEGLLAKQWAIKQQSYYEHRRSRRTGNRWASLVVKQIWLLGFHMWEHRNNRFHSDRCLAVDDASRKADITIQREYKRGPEDLPVETQSLFRQPLDQRLKASLSERQRWINLVGAERTAVARRRRIGREQRRRFREAFTG